MKNHKHRTQHFHKLKLNHHDHQFRNTVDCTGIRSKMKRKRTKPKDDDASSSSSNSSKDDTKNNERTQQTKKSTSRKILTAAEMIKRKINPHPSTVTVTNTDTKIQTQTQNKNCGRVEEVDAIDNDIDDIDNEIDDIDSEIKRLEAELAKSDSDDDSSSSEDDDDDQNDDSDIQYRNSRKKKIRFGETSILNKEDVRNEEPKGKVEAVICTSACASDSIPHLPASTLPKCKSKKLKIDLQNNDNDADGTKNRKRKNSSSTVQSDGLRAAVMEVLGSYTPRSSERIPFYCRVCSYQSKNEIEFSEHKRTEFHKAAVEIERKKTYCKLCRKQLTSLVQMQEHLDSRPHKDRLESLKARQRGEPFNRQPRRDYGMSSGRGGGGRHPGRWQPNSGRDAGRGRGRGRGTGRFGRF